ncbi:MAG: Ig-like domain-containing protein [Candidatus Promineofilum sp.]|nr:Ig-like domain-containing protein [Promineifilum sp.]
MSVSPLPNAVGVLPATSLVVTFSEPVTLGIEALKLACTRSQVHALTATGGPSTFTFASDRPFLPGENCDATVFPEGVSDLDSDDPPDSPNFTYSWVFRVASEPVILNELDTVTAGGAADFIELFDGGRGHTDLSGLTLVLYRGDEASVYLAVALDGYMTDDDGYFTLGASGIDANLRLADGTLRDGPDGVGLYAAPKANFPRGAPVTTAQLIDAVVYGPADEALRVLLAAGQTPLDEDARGASATDSNQRCPNGTGQPRATAAFVQSSPTAGAPNACRFDAAPAVVAISPAAGATAVAVDAVLRVTFSEPVALAAEPLEFVCTRSSTHAYSQSGGPTVFTFSPHEPLVAGERCEANLRALRISDADVEDPPDLMSNDFPWTFQTVRAVAEGLLINEIDADTPGVDTAEFVELFDGGRGSTSLDGLSIVFFNGVDDRSYLSVSLEGRATDEDGYFLLGNAAVAGAGIVLPDGALQNGPDAVALVVGDAGDFPNGTPVAAVNVIDAVVYARPSQQDPGLQPLLEPGQPQIDENGRGEGGAHSNQRCPNGAGGPRKTAGYKQNTPTSRAINNCVTDKVPAVIGMTPAGNEKGVGLGAAITITFDEAVHVAGKWLTVICSSTGTHNYQSTGGPTVFTITMNAPFTYDENCTVTVNASLVTDQDTDDPPDAMAGPLSWSFSTAKPPAGFILINEIDADTMGSDTAEFIELYDGGSGHTPLDGLALVLFNGSTNRSYKAVDLDGFKTDAAGYFVVGNAAVSPGLLIGNGTLQNGPDGVALYAADATQFPTDSPVSQNGLIDAIVYGDPDSVTPELLALLANAQNPVDENERGAADLHSLQRCPNGAGGHRHTESYQPNLPTAGKPSACASDEPPMLLAGSPPDGATNVSIYSHLSLTFSEPVDVQAGGITLSCAGGDRSLLMSGGPLTFEFAPALPLPAGVLCQVRLTAALITDADLDDPPDHPTNDSVWSFTTGAAPVTTILINEIDADTPGSDKQEFIELFDGGAGHTDLANLVLVLYNGSDARSYLAIDLSGLRTDGDGYLLVGNEGVADVSTIWPTGGLQNGPDAAALYTGRAAHFPNGTPLHTAGLLDAVVYGAGDPPHSALLALLLPGENQIDEAGSGPADLYASGRCPDGAGGGRRTLTFRQGTPSPGGPNVCLEDTPPAVIAINPADGANNVSATATATLKFSEAVVVEPGWFAITCNQSGPHASKVAGGPSEYSLTPNSPFAAGETCTVILTAALIADTDSDDPPDHPAADFRWSFTTAVSVPPPSTVLINEVDADTPGSDVEEFIELYDGGTGHTDLSGLVVVFWNGSNDKVYRAIDLDGRQTGDDGYFVLGNQILPVADMIFADRALQNGPDAVAVYVGSAADFPAGAALTTDGLIDAVVYGPAASPDEELLVLLADGQRQTDEAGGGDAESHSLQRCPNGAGGAGRTAAFRPDPPTPGAPNPCTAVDAAPLIVAVSPIAGARDVVVGSPIQLEFSEDVTVTVSRLSILCHTSSLHSVTLSGGPRLYVLMLAVPFAPNEDCAVTIPADAISDLDEIDPPNTLPADYMWAFHTKAAETPPSPTPPLSTPPPTTPPPPTPQPPVAGFVATGPVWIGEDMGFTNTSTGNGPLVFTWDFGDGRPLSHDVHPTHRYAAVGSYIATLTVSGPTGTAIHKGVIQVRARQVYLAMVGR